MNPIPHTTAPVDPSAISGARTLQALLAAAVAAVVLLAYGVYLSNRAEQHRADDRRLKAFAAIKAGRAEEATVSDGQLVAMLANDPQCVENCRLLVFSNVDFAEDGFQRLSELVHLVDVGVYSSDRVDLMLTYLQGLPEIEKIWIESSPVTDVGVGLITTFPGLQHLHFEQPMPVRQISYLKSALPRLKLGYLLSPTGGQ